MNGNLSVSDPVGVSFWIISMAMVASTAFFFLERDRVSGKWKTSLTVAGLVTLIAAVHYYYMRDVWVGSGESPTVFRYIDWLLTVPLQMVEFYLILAAITAVSWSILASIYWFSCYAFRWLPRRGGLHERNGRIHHRDGRLDIHPL